VGCFVLSSSCVASGIITLSLEFSCPVHVNPVSGRPVGMALSLVQGV
jgi:hypothetical protein